MKSIKNIDTLVGQFNNRINVLFHKLNFSIDRHILSLVGEPLEESNATRALLFQNEMFEEMPYKISDILTHLLKIFEVRKIDLQSQSKINAIVENQFNEIEKSFFTNENYTHCNVNFLGTNYSKYCRESGEQAKRLVDTLVIDHNLTYKNWFQRKKDEILFTMLGIIIGATFEPLKKIAELVSNQIIKLISG